MIFNILATVWWIRTTKVVLFYLYLWQLKEYHIGRFLDHFQTAKGKKLIFNRLTFLKIIIFIVYFYLIYFFPSFIYLPSFLIFFLFTIYLAESLKALSDLLKRKLKLPVPTAKALILVLVVFSFETLFIFLTLNFAKDTISFILFLLSFDILAPAIISAIVLILQPLTVVLRSGIILRAKMKRKSLKDLFVIGITGSYGKTSTKEFLYTILSQKFSTVRTKEHQNSEVGISRCIINELRPDHEIFIVEMGAYGRGGIKLLADITKPKIGVLMGANEQHLSLFHSIENIISAEGGKELIDSLPEDSLGIFNGDNKYSLELYEMSGKPKRIFSAWPKNLKFQPDIWAEGTIVDKKSLFFKTCSKEGCTNFKVYLSGAHFVPNLLAAITTAKELGMSSEEINDACLKIRPQENTMNIIEGIGNLLIVDDSYSANPEGVMAALEYLKIYPQKKVIIMPSLIELGSASKEVHKRIGEKIGQVCNLAIITTEDRFKEIEEGTIEAGLYRENILFIENPEEIFNKIIDFCNGEGIILLEGRTPERLINLLTQK